MNWCRSGLSSALGEMGVYLQPVGCILLSAVVNGLYRQSQGVASSSHFLLLRLVSSRSQLCTSGAILPAGRVGLQPPQLFLFLWCLRLGAARCWKGLEGYSP